MLCGQQTVIRPILISDILCHFSCRLITNALTLARALFELEVWVYLCSYVECCFLVLLDIL